MSGVKAKMDGLMKIFSQAIIQPVMFMAVTGIIMPVCAIMMMSIMPAGMVSVGSFVYNTIMKGIISQLPVIFCVGIATALAKRKKTDAAVLSLITFLVFIYANNAWLSNNGMLVQPERIFGSGQAMVLGVQVVDMGVFLGIILGCLSGYIFNKFSEIQFPDIVSVYGGSRFACLISLAAAMIFAILMCYVWPVVNSGISATAGFIASSGSFGHFLYGFLNRFLIPTGMHHLVYMPFLYTPVGGTAEIAGQMVSGAAPILSTQMGVANTLTQLDPSVKYLMIGFSKVFGTIGIMLAFIKTAHQERKAQIRGLLFPLAALAVLSGVTEPFEFLFLFISPILWLTHSVMDGLFQVLVFVLGSRFPLAAGLINAIPTIIVWPTHLTKWYITFGVGIIAVLVWYFAFVFLIRKFNLKTPGREDVAETTIGGKPSMQLEDSPIQAESVFTQGSLGDVNDIIEGLGGKENIVTVKSCATRLRVEVKDPRLLKESFINKFKNSGIVKKGNRIQIIIGMKVSTVCGDICEILGLE